VHDWGVWWRFWRDPNYTTVGDWRDSCFHILATIFGHIKYAEYVIEERDVVIPFPEKVYDGHVKLFDSKWKRPRWFASYLTRTDVAVEEGVPHEGKGENSWDCGERRTFSMTCTARTIAEGVGRFIGSVLEDRVKYGGWDDWNYHRDSTLSEKQGRENVLVNQEVKVL